MRLRNRLILQLTLLLLVTCALMGVVGHALARRALNGKGETILQNSVRMARQLIRSYQEQETAGLLTREEAQEQVKEMLMGPRNADGTRSITHAADLGKHGYFIVYDTDGNEVMHPTLEGQNVWNVTDPNRPDFFLVRDQIQKGIQGGGFTYYDWMLPNAERIRRKISYSEHEPNWGWIVCATAYLIDFNAGATAILVVTLLLGALSVAAGVAVSWEFVRRVTIPVEGLLQAMKQASRLEQGPYLVKKDGTLRKDEIGRLVQGYNALIEQKDLARRRIEENEREMTRLAFYDELSTLPNRNLFRQTVEASIQNGLHHGLFLLLDIRHFRLVNTLRGEAFGDELIRMAGALLGSFVSETNTIARYSGDEFAGWAIGWEEGQVERNVARFRQMLQQRLSKKGEDLKIDLRTGYARYPEHGTDFQTLYRHATLAVREAKELGANAIVSYNQAMHARMAREEQLRQLLEQAIEDKAFSLAYQPKVNPKTGQAAGVEALARWTPKELGAVSPAIFIPLVESGGLIARFGEMIIEKAMADWSRLERKYGPAFTLSINLSPAHLFDGNLETCLFEQIKRHGADASRILLEITEHEQIKDFGRIRHVMSRLKEFGIRFSLDDFGTGYSSLSYIRQLPLDELKIDREFVQALQTDPHAPVLLEIICRIARSYRLVIVAEGVETHDQQTALMAAGVDLVQGYLHARPEPIGAEP